MLSVRVSICNVKDMIRFRFCDVFGHVSCKTFACDILYDHVCIPHQKCGWVIGDDILVLVSYAAVNKAKVFFVFICDG